MTKIMKLGEGIKPRKWTVEEKEIYDKAHEMKTITEKVGNYSIRRSSHSCSLKCGKFYVIIKRWDATEEELVAKFEAKHPGVIQYKYEEKMVPAYPEYYRMFN